MKTIIFGFVTILIALSTVVAKSNLYKKVVVDQILGGEMIDVDPNRVELDNGILAIQFYEETINSTKVVRSKLFRYVNGKRVPAPQQGSSEGYYLLNLDGLSFSQDRFYSYWIPVGKKRITDEDKIWSPFNVPNTKKLIPNRVSKEGSKIKLEFDAVKEGTLIVIWSIENDKAYFNVRMDFKPNDSNHYALGYKLFMEKEHGSINELLLPMMWQQKRFPEKSYTLFDSQMPTPVSMIDFGKDNSRYSYGIVSSPEAFEYKWPSQLKRKIGMLIRNEEGLVQPAISGPFDVENGRKVSITLDFKIQVDQSDWYQSFRSICDDIYQLTDYRSNYNTSLTDAVLNMIDLIKDDYKTGWWDRAKGFYQIESRNGSTQAVPLVLLSLYHLTGDMDIYKKRTLPTLEYTLSRSGFHFTPIPNDAGHYEKADMSGPIGDFGSTFYGGAWEMTNRLMPIFKDIAFPDQGIRRASRWKEHIQEFGEWLSRYELLNEEGSLEKARELADQYILDFIEKPAEKDLGLDPFFLVSFVPDWEALLRLYEVTGTEKYLDAALVGAKWLTTGIWTQPLIPDGETTIHRGNTYPGDLPGLFMARGDDSFRLGYDMDKNSPGYRSQLNPPKEKDVPSWLVSNVGLGFEQAAWIFSPSDPERKVNRLIYQAPWTPDFLRLALYSKDKTYEKYARNAVVGRWSNYPGYYVTGFTDSQNQSDYPFIGPDVTAIYYHHIPVHLGWTLDYLLSDAYLLSNGKVDFPFQRQNGYAYFDMRVFGHKPGKAFGNNDLWLWLKKGLINVSNHQINYITAHSDKDLFVILTNQSNESQNVTVSFDKKTSHRAATIYSNGTTAETIIKGGDIDLKLSARGMVMLQIKNPGIAFPKNHYIPAETKHNEGKNKFAISTEVTENISLKGIPIQVIRDFWSAFIWIEADYGDVEYVVFHTSFDGITYKQFRDDEYPFEFSSGIDEDFTKFYYYGEIVARGKHFNTNPQMIVRNQ